MRRAVEEAPITYLADASGRAETPRVGLTDRQGAWMTLSIGILGVIAATLGIIGMAIDGAISAVLLLVLFASAIATVYLFRGVARLRATR
jgi:hypothetical protein